MATGLGATLTSAVTQTVISSSAYNTNLSNINTAVSPSFGTINSDQSLQLTKVLGGSNQVYVQITPSDGTTWGIDELSATNDLAFVSGAAKMQINTGKGVKFLAQGQYLGATSSFTGTTTGTYNHNLGTTPTACLPMQSTSGSQTMGFDTAGASTVHITSGSSNAFTALAYVTTA